MIHNEILSKKYCRDLGSSSTWCSAVQCYRVKPFLGSIKNNSKHSPIKKKSFWFTHLLIMRAVSHNDSKKLPEFKDIYLLITGQRGRNCTIASPFCFCNKCTWVQKPSASRCREREHCKWSFLHFAPADLKPCWYFEPRLPSEAGAANYTNDLP